MPTEQEIKKALHHVEVLNRETGELRDAQRDFNGQMNSLTREFLDFKSDINVKVEGVQTDLIWLKKFFWVIATASVGGVITQVLGFIIRLK